ncbi:MAG: hypothetical protein LZF62_430165 [Nitrospira sp.]|nr:MAG: hypothetical protein LZF62_430165 [Nitrospira sp.]
MSRSRTLRIIRSLARNSSPSATNTSSSGVRDRSWNERDMPPHRLKDHDVDWIQRTTMQVAYGRFLVGCSNGSSSKAADDDKTGGVPCGYVEDLVEARTQVADRFSIRLRFLVGLKRRNLHVEYSPTFTAAQPHCVANHIQLPDGHGDGMGAQTVFQRFSGRGHHRGTLHFAAERHGRNPSHHLVGRHEMHHAT